MGRYDNWSETVRCTQCRAKVVLTASHPVAATSVLLAWRQMGEKCGACLRKESKGIGTCHLPKASKHFC